MNNKVKIRWGIIGLGNIAHQFAKDLMLIDDAELVAVASRNLEKSQEFAKEYDCPKAYSSYEAIINDSEIDILYIATPHNSHAALTIKALKNNKHVLCEKPVALNYDDALQMITTSKANNKFFMEAFWTRFNPSFREAYSKIKNGEIGEIKYINADFAFYADNLEGIGNRKTDMSLGGGSLLDIGVYPLFLCYVVLGIPTEILAKSNFHQTGADLQTSMILQYDNAQAILHSSFVSSSNIKATINGTKGRINLNTIWHQTQSYTLNIGDYEEEILLPTKGKGFTYEIEECHQCIKENRIESNLWSHQNSLDLIKIVDQVRNQIGLEYPS
ncbi:Gfo/Idh/MocA family oxidoreductase [Flavobacterium franklandianum]|uniref:Gfo/Idh/MocA family oxidoreductase n=1 Tax=Flavobacterium franklandianum TaxID=2594430 RepID=A0A553C676_9FLAO|nr:Gfo/Idh/MocA family oxidoreductase [Flavobacterium franklandianum]TRX16021.1 Gfo/Idh/MocA family oxidoreductase [Flavobacterium franklandianum]TRX23537.1 Gfo/Idh/MocA family oxidoreductase [Flavobacterium franklandianum]